MTLIQVGNFVTSFNRQIYFRIFAVYATVFYSGYIN
jgi:hypothetical protein